MAVADEFIGQHVIYDSTSFEYFIHHDTSVVASRKMCKEGFNVKPGAHTV